MWDSLYNIVLLLFWSRLWLTDDQEMVVNRYLAAYGRLQQRAIDFLQPVLPFMGPRSIAMMSLLVLIVFRGLAVPNDAEWRLSFGFIIGQTQASSIPSRIVFSTLSFALFLFKIWGISLVYVWHRQQVTFRSTIDALYQLARPFTDVPLAWRPVLLLGFGGGLAFALTWIGGASLVPGTGLIHVPQLLTISLMAWVHLLPIIQQVLFLVIIGSFAGGFMGHLASEGKHDPATLRRAMLHGTVTASFCVQDFGIGPLAGRGKHELEARYDDLLGIVTV